MTAKPNTKGRRGPYPDATCRRCGGDVVYWEDFHKWGYLCLDKNCPGSWEDA